jgi:hypothetical protein
MARVGASPWLIALAALSLSLSLSPSAARAADRAGAATEANQGAARAAYEHALELFDEGQHAAALAEFRRAYALAPSFRILVNVGLALVALADPSSAVEAFTQYLQDGAEKIPAERRQQVQAELTRLSSQLALLDIDVEQAGAELSVDGELLGRGPISRQLRLNPGRHTASVRSPDGTLRTQSVSIGRGQEQHLRFSGSDAAGAPPAPTPQSPAGAPPASKPHEPRPVAPYIAWGATGALGVAAGVTGVLALGAHADQRDLKLRRGVSHADLAAAADRVQTRALASDLLFGATALMAGVSLYLTLRPTTESDSVATLTVSPGNVRLTHAF